MPQLAPIVPYIPYIISAAGIAYGVYASKKAQSKASSSADPLSGYQINTRSSREPLPIPYGLSRPGVNKTFLHVKNPYLP